MKNSNDGLTITVKQDNEVSGEQFSTSSQVEILLKGIVGFPPWILKSVIPQPADLLTKKWLRSKKAAPYNILGPLHWSYLRDTVFQIKRSFWSFWRELCISYYLIRSITVKKRLIGVGSLFQECDIGTKWMVILLKCFKYLCLPAVHQGLLRIALPRSDSDSRIEEEEIIFLNILLTICTLYKAKEVIFIFFYGDW